MDQKFVMNWVKYTIVILLSLSISNFVFTGSFIFVLGNYDVLQLMLAAAIASVIVTKFIRITDLSGKEKVGLWFLVLGEIIFVLVLASFIDSFINFPILSVFLATGGVLYIYSKM